MFPCLLNLPSTNPEWPASSVSTCLPGMGASFPFHLGSCQSCEPTGSLVMSKGSKEALCGEFYLVPLTPGPQIRSVFTQCQTTDGIAENKTIEIRSFSENEVQKLEDRYRQRPGESPAVWLVFPFDKGTLQTPMSQAGGPS